MGPSDESETATSNTGEAAHINSASPGKGARRHDPSLTPEQRKSIDNGIWCCNTHAELIDADEITYTVDLLKSWRRLAEIKAKIRQAHGAIELSLHPELVSMGIAPESLSVVSDNDGRQKIGRAVEFSCVADVWGARLAGALRDFLIEYSRNAITHGAASAVGIKFLPHCIEITDDGTLFDIQTLRDPQGSRGGGMAYRALISAFKLSAISVERGADGVNKAFIPLVSSALELPRVNPCAVVLSGHRDPTEPLLDFQVLSSCNRLYVIAHDYSCYSDAPAYERTLAQIVRHNPNVTVIFQNISDEVLSHFRETLVDVEIVGWQVS